jgi:branched-subunit amino acid transport protein
METNNRIIGSSANLEETSSTKKIERIRSFANYALQKAGLNNGDATSMKTFLKWIKDGYIVDEAYNEKEHESHRQKIQAVISENKEDREQLECEKKTIQDVRIEEAQQSIFDYEEEIQQTKLDLEQNKINTGYSNTKYFTYVSLTFLLSIYLILFYASAIYASFFRNAASIIDTAGDDIVLYLDNIFDVKGIFTPSPALIIVYLAAFLFFAIGLMPHTMEGKYKKIKVAFAVLGALIVDSLLAYKIDYGIHELKIMAGVADENWSFLTSINFYLVLAFGFVAYLVWGYMYDLMLKEKNKKNAEVCAELVIKDLKNKIRKQKKLIADLNAKVLDLECRVNMLQEKIEELKKELDKAMLNPDLLSQNLTSFYMGWRQFLNGSPDFDSKKDECEQVYNEFMDTHFKKIPSLN